jgi:hypothetical protein
MLTCWFALAFVAISASAQGSPLPRAEEPGATGGSSELAELQARRQELRDRLADWKAKSSEYLRVGQEAGGRMSAIDQEIELLENRDAISVPDDVTAAKLDALLLDAEQDLAAARRDALDLEKQAEQRSERRRRVPELLSVAKQRLIQLETTPSAASANPAATALQAEVDALRREVLRAEIEAYQNELSSYDARGELLSKARTTGRSAPS